MESRVVPHCPYKAKQDSRPFSLDNLANMIIAKSNTHTDLKSRYLMALTKSGRNDSDFCSLRSVVTRWLPPKRPINKKKHKRGCRAYGVPSSTHRIDRVSS